MVMMTFAPVGVDQELVGDFVFAGFHFGDAWRRFGVGASLGESVKSPWAKALEMCFRCMRMWSRLAVSEGIVGMDLDDSSCFGEGEVMGGFGLVEAHNVAAAGVHGGVVVLLGWTAAAAARQQE